ncbi:hypothetical protein [Collimonas pratensis]|uniref:hypothetical protein n=1 Tax=Collimonas pratensis TaxID=279113 RepID=UPI00197F8034|nr:hypothetical protein [Collimonas pratensis]
MNTTSPSIILNARRASRAIGTMFFSAFGCAWLILWSYSVFGVTPIVLGVLVTATIILFSCALLRYHRYRDAFATVTNSPERRRTMRVFNIVNAVQWALIIIVANVFPRFGMTSWIMPSIIFIVGLHFLPLARIFSSRPHYVTGSSLMLLAIAYPLFAQAGASDPVGCLGAGIILWASAVWGLSTDPTSGTRMIDVPNKR